MFGADEEIGETLEQEKLVDPQPKRKKIRLIIIIVVSIVVVAGLAVGIYFIVKATKKDQPKPQPEPEPTSKPDPEPEPTSEPEPIPEIQVNLSTIPLPNDILIDDPNNKETMEKISIHNDGSWKYSGDWTSEKDGVNSDNSLILYQVDIHRPYQILLTGNATTASKIYNGIN